MKLLNKYVLLVFALGCGGGGQANSTPSLEAGVSSRLESGVNDSSHKLSPDSSRALTPDSRRKVLMFVGTSLTAGLGLEPDSAYPARIQRLLDSARLNYEVVNAGYSGETSSGLLRRLDWLLRAPFDVIVIETGANDGLRGIPVETMRTNIQQILDKVRGVKPDAQIILVQMEALPNLGRAYTQGFHDVFPDLARRNNVTLLPFLLEDVAGVRSLNQADGIHPNDAGERIVTENVWKGLRPLLR